MKKKGAIGLSINVLVTIIISLMILGGGLILINKFFTGAEDIKTDLDKRTNDELERLLVSEEKRVALPLQLANVPRGKDHLFGIGILNTLGKNENFMINIEFKRLIDVTENDITNQVDKKQVENWLFFNSEPVFISDAGHFKESILVTVPKNAVIGQYIFIAKVSTSLGESYGNPQTFYVNVI